MCVYNKSWLFHVWVNKDLKSYPKIIHYTCTCISKTEVICFLLGNQGQFFFHVLKVLRLEEFPKLWKHSRNSTLTLSLPGVISHDFLFQSLTRDISYSMENLAIDSLLRQKLIEQSFLTTSLNHFVLEWLGEFTLWAWDWKGLW